MVMEQPFDEGDHTLLSISPSLSHTHTHTHSLSLSDSISISLSRSHCVPECKGGQQGMASPLLAEWLEKAGLVNKQFQKRSAPWRTRVMMIKTLVRCRW